jgi:4-hydroxybenzoate polyprenyltransferase
MKLYYFIKLSRPINLLIIALTMLLLRYLIIKPFLFKNNIELVITTIDFALLIVSTLMIAGAGNIINDYFDIRPDRVNKRRRIIVGKYIERREAMIAHVLLSTLGFFVAGYVAHKYHIDWILIFQIMAITLLWFYSASFKKSFIVGNLIVAFLTANIPLIVIGYDLPVLFNKMGYHFPFLNMDIGPIIKVIYFTFGYAAFAFLLNLIREIIKDMGDVRGDMEIDAQTMPITIGKDKTRQVVNSITLFTIIALVYVQQVYLPDPYTSVYLLIAVILPLIVSILLLKKANKARQFLKVANQTKWAMAGGLGYLVVFYFFVINNYSL